MTEQGQVKKSSNPITVDVVMDFTVWQKQLEIMLEAVKKVNAQAHEQSND